MNQTHSFGSLRPSCLVKTTKSILYWIPSSLIHVRWWFLGPRRQKLDSVADDNCNPFDFSVLVANEFFLADQQIQERWDSPHPEDRISGRLNWNKKPEKKMFCVWENRSILDPDWITWLLCLAVCLHRHEMWSHLSPLLFLWHPLSATLCCRE